jgi:hypothetical protein
VHCTFFVYAKSLEPGMADGAGTAYVSTDGVGVGVGGDAVVAAGCVAFGLAVGVAVGVGAGGV